MNKTLIALLLCLAIITPALALKGPPSKKDFPPPPKNLKDLKDRLKPKSSDSSSEDASKSPPAPKSAAEHFEGAYKNKIPEPSDEQKAF